MARSLYDEDGIDGPFERMMDEPVHGETHNPMRGAGCSGEAAARLADQHYADLGSSWNGMDHDTYDRLRKAGVICAHVARYDDPQRWCSCEPEVKANAAE